MPSDHAKRKQEQVSRELRAYVGTAMSMLNFTQSNKAWPGLLPTVYVSIRVAGRLSVLASLVAVHTTSEFSVNATWKFLRKSSD